MRQPFAGAQRRRDRPSIRDYQRTRRPPPYLPQKPLVPDTDTHGARRTRSPFIRTNTPSTPFGRRTIPPVRLPRLPRMPLPIPALLFLPGIAEEIENWLPHPRRLAYPIGWWRYATCGPIRANPSFDPRGNQFYLTFNCVGNQAIPAGRSAMVPWDIPLGTKTIILGDTYTEVSPGNWRHTNRLWFTQNFVTQPTGPGYPGPRPVDLPAPDPEWLPPSPLPSLAPWLRPSHWLSLFPAPISYSWVPRWEPGWPDLTERGFQAPTRDPRFAPFLQPGYYIEYRPRRDDDDGGGPPPLGPPDEPPDDPDDIPFWWYGPWWLGLVSAAFSYGLGRWWLTPPDGFDQEGYDYDPSIWPHGPPLAWERGTGTVIKSEVELDLKPEADGKVQVKNKNKTKGPFDMAPENRKKSKKKEKEKKYQMSMKKWPIMFAALNGITESLDFVNAMWKSLPYKFQSRVRFRGKDGRWHTRRPSQMQRIWDLYEHFDHMDLTQAVHHWASNEIEDQFYARLGRQGPGAQYAARGFGWGPWDSDIPGRDGPSLDDVWEWLFGR